MPFLNALRLDAILSFPPGSEEIALTPLNVLIGPNGSGKSNLIEALELLHATPTAFATPIREGGGVREWLWKGDGATGKATIEARIKGQPQFRDLRYRLGFTASGQYTEVTDEVIETLETNFPSESDQSFSYRYQGGAAITVWKKAGSIQDHKGPRGFAPDESVLSQLKDPDRYPELTWVGQQFARIQMLRDWTFGPSAQVRQPQRADLPEDTLLPDSRNLGLILNQLEHNTDALREFNSLLSRFLPRYERFSTRILGGTLQFYLHEQGLKTPVPATRLSDGTIRFMAMLALLLSPAPPPLICMEEPELGLHPDALALLANLMVEASERTQLIITTHSDALVSALTEQANSVLVCEYRGGTMLHRVDSDKLSYWLDRYRLGEIWRIGELGGNP